MGGGMDVTATRIEQDDLDAFETQRLTLRRLSLEDAAFILALVNEPSWLAHIGDKHVRTLDDARRYIAEGPMAMYARHGFGLYLVERRTDAEPLGICGLLKRDTLDDVDIGFAFLPAHWGRGYAREAAVATLTQAREAFGLARVVAIASPGNASSIRLLESVGFVFERALRMPGEDHDVRLFGYST
jgi:ribosomal-protein-alanine N-acetyltransferase